MKDVRPKIKRLLANLPVPKWDPHRTFVSLPRGDAPDIPFCHYTPLKTIFFKGAKFEIFEFKFSDYGDIECILRITIDGVMYHVVTCSQNGDGLLYEIFFCKCNDFPHEVALFYMVRERHEIFNISVTGTVEIHYLERLDTKDSEVIEFFQYMVTLCHDFYLANQADLIVCFR